MAEKYIVQNNVITKVVYIGGNQNAKGGRQKIKEQADVLQNHSWTDEGFDYGKAFEEISNGTRIHGEYHEKNSRARKKRRKQVIEELVFNNFEPHNSCMLTLTFSNHEQTAEVYEEISVKDLDVEQELIMMANCLNHPEGQEAVTDPVKIYDPESNKYCDLSYCNRQFKQFIQRMKYRFPLFRYVGVMAQQDSGKWHYHLVCNLNYIPFDELRKIWGRGAVYFCSFKLTGINGLWKAVRYLQKNMRHTELEGEKGYLCSKGLNRNIVYRSWVSNEQVQAKAIEKSLAGNAPNHSYETIHTYYGMDEAGICERELTVQTKYFKYFTSSASQFPKLPNAYLTKRGKL